MSIEGLGKRFQEARVARGLTLDEAARLTKIRLARLQELEAPIKDVKVRVLSEENLTNLQKSFANVHEITESLKKTAHGMDEVVEKAKGAADTFKSVGTSAKGSIDSAATDLKGALADVRKAAATASKALESARALMNSASSGKGALGLLLSDKETADNLKTFLRNLRERGVLWYKDKSK